MLSTRRTAPSLRLPGEELPGSSQPVRNPSQPVTKPEPLPSAGGNSQPAPGHAPSEWHTPS